jgi:hypothetical protein
LKYLLSLGPQVLPILEPRLQHIPALHAYVPGLRLDLGIDGAGMRAANWRAWSFRAWRLQRYLANNPDIPLNPSNPDKTDRG